MNAPDLIRQLTKRKTVLIAAGAALLLLFAFFLLRANGNRPEYRTEPATRGDITAAITATGTVNPVTTVLVGTQVSGTIRNIYVDFNSRVKKGQPIAQIDSATFEAQVQQARANLLAAQANVEKAEATLVDAKRTLERNKDLFAKNLIARSDLDTAETNYETDKAQVSAAKAQVAQTRAALEFAQTNLRYTRIVSPVDGVVIVRNVDVGQTVAASFQTPTLFTIAQDLTKMQVEASVDESDIGRVAVGQDVEFTVDAYPAITFKGTVWQVRRAPQTVQNVVTYDVVIKVPNPDLKLMPGMTANVSVILETKENVLKVPNAAFRFRPANRDKGPQKGSALWVLAEGTPKRIPVTLGVSDGSYTEIVSGDVKEGQEIILEAVSKAKSSAQPTGPRMF
jgi:HlyD family secretion protein